MSSNIIIIINNKKKQMMKKILLLLLLLLSSPYVFTSSLLLLHSIKQHKISCVSGCRKYDCSCRGESNPRQHWHRQQLAEYYKYYFADSLYFKNNAENVYNYMMSIMELGNTRLSPPPYLPQLRILLSSFILVISVKCSLKIFGEEEPRKNRL